MQDGPGAGGISLLDFPDLDEAARLAAQPQERGTRDRRADALLGALRSFAVGELGVCVVCLLHVRAHACAVCGRACVRLDVAAWAQLGCMRHDHVLASLPSPPSFFLYLLSVCPCLVEPFLSACASLMLPHAPLPPPSNLN